MRSMSSVLTPRSRSTANSGSPKSSPTGPTTRTSEKNDAASEKWTAEPPSMRSRSPNGVRTASNAIDPTTVTVTARGSVPPIGSSEPMRAIQIEEFGGPEVLQLVDLPVPEAGDGEVLIRVDRAGMNYADTHQRTNDYLAPYDLPLVPGAEVVGVREDTGERVVAMSGTSGYAEYATAPEALTFPVPDGVDDATALALLVQGLTAWHLYKTCARVQPGETVVIIAAAGGVGSLAVQLGKPLGAGRVIAVSSPEAKRELTLQLGADAAIDAAPDGLADRLPQANLGH